MSIAEWYLEPDNECRAEDETSHVLNCRKFAAWRERELSAKRRVAERKHALSATEHCVSSDEAVAVLRVAISAARDPDIARAIELSLNRLNRTVQ
jgi:hypothetical protein